MAVYSKIFKQAYFLTRKHKFLWTFGLFLVWDALFFLSFIFSNPDKNQNTQQHQQVQAWLTARPSFTLAFAAGLLVLFAVFILLYFRARAGLIMTVKGILDKQQVSFKKGFKLSKLFYLRLFGSSIILTACLILTFIVLAVPVAYLWSLGFLFRASLLGFFALLIFVPISFIASLVNVLSPMFIVQYDLTIEESIKQSLNLVGKLWLKLLAFHVLLTIAVWTALFACLFVVFLLSLPVVLLSSFFYDKLGAFFGALTVGTGMTVIGIIFLTMLAGIAVFYQTSWVLAFQELVKPEAQDETEAVSLPEIVS
ncbi:MAG TPA: hypothetical protein VGQ87_01475 [Patescibacteria group bacterium]|jgi:hypothetical protein|nr:hypothetical protein [Patescibacteria group bacterium]